MDNNKMEHMTYHTLTSPGEQQIQGNHGNQHMMGGQQQQQQQHEGMDVGYMSSPGHGYTPSPQHAPSPGYLGSPQGHYYDFGHSPGKIYVIITSW